MLSHEDKRDPARSAREVLVRLGLVLKAGITSLVLLPAMGLTGSAPVPETRIGTAEVRVSVVGGPKVATPPTVVVVEPLAWRGGELTTREVTRAKVGEPMMLAPGRWRISAFAKGFWIEHRVIDLSEGRRADVKLRAWPAGILRFRVVLADSGNERPDAEVVFRRTSPAGGLPEEGVGACRHDDATLCALPRGVFDIRVFVSGCAPVYRWATDMRAGETTDLGTLRAAPGGSVMGFVERRDHQPGKSVRVRLVTADGQVVERRPSGRGAEDAGGVGGVETVTDQRGFFQITGLPPGQFRIVASASDNASGQADTKIDADSETRLGRAIVLGPPASLEVTIEPPTHPSGTTWRVALHDLDSDPSDSRQEWAVPLGGVLRTDGISEGHYALFVETLDGQRCLMEEVDVRSPATQLHLSIPFGRVRGQLRLGGDPLVGASLVFGGRKAAVRALFRSDEDGRFEGYLSRAGAWAVDVEATEPPVRRFLKQVLVRETVAREYEVALELPDTRLSGQVVDENLRAVASALVRVNPLTADDRTFQTQVDNEGRFVIRGLPTGSMVISAVAPDQKASDAMLTTLSEEGRGSSVLITVRQRRRFEGRVILRGGGNPVAGAFLKVSPVSELPPMPPPFTTTDVDGHFEVLLPPSTREADVTYGSPLNSIAITRVPVLPAQETTLPIDAEGGQLIFDIGSGRPSEGHQIIIIRERATEYLDFLVSVAAARAGKPEGGGYTDTGNRIVVGPLSPGRYTACLASTEDIKAGRRPSGSAGCVSGTLVVGGELVLRLP